MQQDAKKVYNSNINACPQAKIEKTQNQFNTKILVIQDKMRSLNIDNLAPLQALKILSELKLLLQS